MVKIRKQLKNQRKEELKNECVEGEDVKNENPPKLRRSSRLKGMMKKTCIKGTEIIDIEEEEISIQTPVDRSPIYQYEENSSRRTPDVDPAQ